MEKNSYTSYQKKPSHCTGRKGSNSLFNGSRPCKAVPFLVTAAFLILSCKEVYTPEIKGTTRILVVDGLITDEIKPHVIRISTAVKFDTLGYIPEKGAAVYVTDDNGLRFAFNESADGAYISDPDVFKPQVGRKYVLTIETRDQRVYRSSVQELLPKGTITKLANFPQKVKYYVERDNKLVANYTKGSDFIASFSLQGEEAPYYRFTSAFLVEYLFWLTPGSGKINYCWMKLIPDVEFNLNDRQHNISGVFQQNLGFCPIDSFYYNLLLKRIEVCCPRATIFSHNVVHQYAASFKQYHLNEDVYNYYSLLNKQLGATQRIFDPLTFQVDGNISCISDPGAKAFGVFEVASVSSKSFKINYNILNATYPMTEISIDMDSIPDSGGDTVPAKFWIY